MFNLTEFSAQALSGGHFFFNRTLTSQFFLAALRKRKIYECFSHSSFFHCRCFAFSVGTAGATLREANKKKGKKVFHLTSVYLYRPLHFVCSNMFIITPRDIQLFADRNALEQGHFIFTKHLLVLLPNHVILQCFIFRATGSNDERSK